MGFFSKFGESAIASAAAKVVANKSVDDIHELFVSIEIPIDKVLEYCGAFISKSDLERLRTVFGSGVSVNIGEILEDMGLSPREFAQLLKEPKGIDKAKALFTERMALIENSHAKN